MFRLSLVWVFLVSFLLSYDVTVSILPLKYFVKQIGGDKVDVNVMVGYGYAPNIYEPKPSQMKRLNSSKLFFYLGVPFESVWLDRFKSQTKNTIYVDSSMGIEKLEMASHSHGEEDHEEEEHKDEDEEHIKDPHTWLSPALAKVHAKNILDALIKIDANNKDFYTKNYENLIGIINGVDDEVRSILKDVPSGFSFLVFHPSWGYFAKDYDLEQIAIEIEGKEPKIKDLYHLIEELKDTKIEYIFTQKGFPKRAVKEIQKELGIKAVMLDPLSEFWDENLISTAKRIANIARDSN